MLVDIVPFSFCLSIPYLTIEDKHNLARVITVRSGECYSRDVECLGSERGRLKGIVVDEG